MPNGSSRKKVNLALQGGGAYGAFTWGVLDHVLEDGRLEIEGITGASSGAVNAIMLADGLARGGPEEARRRLADFWRATSLGGNLPDAQRQAVDRLFSFLPFEDSPMGIWFKAMSRYLSPYDFNPLNINPLKELIERFVDFEVVRESQIPRVFVSATNVLTGRLRIFPHDKITADAIVASACLPHLFRAVEIDGVPYWDGGYLGNPSIFPLFRTTTTEDVLFGANQSAGAPRDADLEPCDHGPFERGHVQFPTHGRIARDRVRRPADRSGPAAARHRAGQIPPHLHAPDRDGGLRQGARFGEPAQHRLRFLQNAA
jgi:predicted acylesterase/phospholipase RssA